MFFYKNIHFYCLLLIAPCTFFFSTQPMSEAELMLRATQHVESCLESLKDILEFPDDPSFFETVFSSAKTVSSKFFELCYNHPKLLLGGTTLTLGLVALRSSGYWPVTKYDLKKFKNESLQHLTRRVAFFTQNTNNRTSTRSEQLTRAINASHEQLLQQNNNIDQAESAVIELPDSIASFLHQVTQRALSTQHHFFQAAQSKQDQTMIEAYVAIISQLKNNQEMLVTRLEKIFACESKIDKQANVFLQKIIDKLDEESKKSNLLYNALYEENSAQIAVFESEQKDTTAQIRSLLDIVSELEVTSEPFEQLTEILNEQEKLLDSCEQFINNDSSKNLSEKLK